MPVYRRMLIVEDVVNVHRLYVDVITLATQQDRLLRAQGFPAGNARMLKELQDSYATFKRGLDAVAARGATTARNRIEEILQRTQKRGDTGIFPHLRDRIVCRPLAPVAGFPTGAVGVADEDVLDRQNGWYWRVQEYGSGSAEVKSIVGHTLRGYFYDRGFRNPIQPLSAALRQPLFAPGPPIGASSPPLPFGKGTVQREIQARHFISGGAALAEAQWRAELKALESATVTELRIAQAAMSVRTPARVP